MLRPGSAGNNTAADHLAVLDAAITALPPGFRRRLMVTCDGAGASHDLIARLDKLAARPGYQVTYSIGWELGKREREAITAVPAAAWQAAVDARGQVRERRADQACGNSGCAHRKCWVEEAHVTELTGLLRERPAGDQLAGWPGAMRVLARRERPHPGTQLTLFEAEDGWRYSLRVTNRPAATKGWLGQNAYLDAAHRVHARVAALASALEARAYAVTGRGTETRGALARAEDVLSQLDGDSLPSAFGYNEASFRFHEGDAYTHLRDFKAAMRAQDRALELCPPDNYADWAMTRLDRAQCLIHAGDVTSGLEYANETVTTITAAQRQGIIALRGREIMKTLPESEKKRAAAELGVSVDESKLFYRIEGDELTHRASP